MAKKDESYILKKMREELGTEPWRTQYPSTIISWDLKGDASYCEQLRGEAKAMLYNLKNRMKLSALAGPPYGLKSLQDIHQYDDGTVIIVKSVYGQDFIEINAGVGFPSCSIILFDVPLTVQPMYWYSDGIHDAAWLILNPGGELEVEGVDYIKTYYSYSSKGCAACTLDLSVCDTAELATTYGLFAPQTCKPFVFVGETIPIKEGYPNNHCVYGTCQAEIISLGVDSGGTYFLWKAYTEWSQLGPPFGEFTKTGLGYLLLRGFTNFGGKQLCTSSSSIVKVDCCEKVLAERIPIIYWEKCIGQEWCVAPSSGTQKDDLDYFWVLGGWVLMTLWAKENWCKPMTWTISGIGEITGSEDGTYGYYSVSYTELGESGCTAPIIITGTDRCGTSDSITFTSCCDSSPDPLSMGYTSLQMSCSGAQNLTASGGCPPYTFSLTAGGGTLVDNGNGTATYTAPATNPECANNATITLTDCCGSTDSIQIAVNCYTPNDVALRLCEQVVDTCECTSWYQGVCTMYGFTGTFYRTDWNCAGVVLSDVESTTGPGGLGCNPIQGQCGSDCMLTSCGCVACDPSFACGAGPCNIGMRDIRTPLMKTQGCCPLNPLTGLPY